MNIKKLLQSMILDIIVDHPSYNTDAILAILRDQATCYMTNTKNYEHLYFKEYGANLYTIYKIVLDFPEIVIKVTEDLFARIDDEYQKQL